MEIILQINSPIDHVLGLQLIAQLLLSLLSYYDNDQTLTFLSSDLILYHNTVRDQTTYLNPEGLKELQKSHPLGGFQTSADTRKFQSIETMQNVGSISPAVCCSSEVTLFAALIAWQDLLPAMLSTSNNYCTAVGCQALCCAPRVSLTDRINNQTRASCAPVCITEYVAENNVHVSFLAQTFLPLFRME